jgi:hypothetical protein
MQCNVFHLKVNKSMPHIGARRLHAKPVGAIQAWPLNPFLPGKVRLNDFPAADDSQQDNYYCNYQKNVNETANGVGGNQPQKPQ